MAMLQACLNGGWSKAQHPGVPVTPEELASAAASAASSGVRSLHVHPRDERGRESVAARDVGAAVAAIRARVPGLEIGVTTGEWIEPDPTRRLTRVADWASLGDDRPDLTSVNVHEPGWRELCSVLGTAGIAVELGVFHVEAASTLHDVGLPDNAVRVLAEVQPHAGARAVAEADRLVRALRWVELPVLLHGEDAGTWPVLLEAARRSLDTRIGLEDTWHLPDGALAADNTALVDAAATLVA